MAANGLSVTEVRVLGRVCVLMAAAQKKQGDTVWIKDAQHVWAAASVTSVSVKDGTVTATNSETGQVRSLPPFSTHVAFVCLDRA